MLKYNELQILFYFVFYPGLGFQLKQYLQKICVIEMYIKYVIKSIFCFKCTGVKFYNSSHIVLFLFVLVSFYTPPRKKIGNYACIQSVDLLFCLKRVKSTLTLLIYLSNNCVGQNRFSIDVILLIFPQPSQILDLKKCR